MCGRSWGSEREEAGVAKKGSILGKRGRAGPGRRGGEGLVGGAGYLITLVSDPRCCRVHAGPFHSTFQPKFPDIQSRPTTKSHAEETRKLARADSGGALYPSPGPKIRSARDRPKELHRASPSKIILKRRVTTPAREATGRTREGRITRKTSRNAAFLRWAREWES